MDSRPIPLIGAPTATGKTELVLQLAADLPLEVVSADSMQVYRGMDIGTAKPSQEEQAKVPHHLINIVDPNATFNVANFVSLAEDAIRDILARGRVPLVIGVTGFYLRALTQGLPTVPSADPTIQEEIWKRLEENGLEQLKKDLRTISPIDAERAGNNPRRVVRALEIIQVTGAPPNTFPYTKPAFTFAKLALIPTLDVIEPRIIARVEEMFAQGLVTEVRKLMVCFPNCFTATQAIGYKETMAHIEGQATLNEAKAAVVLATRQYARRQRTWFSRESGAQKIQGLASEAEPKVRRWLNKLYFDQS